MRAITETASQDSHRVERTTLLDLVWRVGQTTDDEVATVDTVTDLLVSGRAELTGNFRGVPVERVLA